MHHTFGTVKTAVFLLAAALVFASGCASVPAQVKQAEPPAVKPAPVIQDDGWEYNAVRVIAKKQTKLEQIKTEAARKNYKETSGIAAGAIAGIATFAAMNAAIGNPNKIHPAIQLAATAAAAYGAAYLTEAIFEWINPKKKIK